MQNQVQDKEEENSALQREMSDARRKHEEATQVGTYLLSSQCEVHTTNQTNPLNTES